MESDPAKMIWQTYRTREDLPVESDTCTHSWIYLNPDWEVHFCADQELRQFFFSFYDGKLSDLYDALPLGAMKAFLWSYAVLSEFGGVYAELDTVCHTPLDKWLAATGAENLHLGCMSDGIEFSPAIIAAPAGHDLLRLAIEVIKERVSAGVDLSKPDPVHYYAGRGVLTEAVRRFLGCQGNASAILADPQSWEGRGIVIHPSKFLNGRHARHINASYNWRHPSSRYISWMDQLNM